MLLRKGVYPYEYMDSWERFDETSLPDKNFFYSELNLDGFTDKDYADAQRRIKTKEPRWLPWFICPKWYIIACGFIWKLYKQVYWNIWTWPCLFFVCTWINMASLFKKVKLVLLTDIDMLLIDEKGIRGVICHSIHRYAKANNKYMKNYDKDMESSYLEYLDLYGWAMSQKPPVNGFEWVE